MIPQSRFDCDIRTLAHRAGDERVFNSDRASRCQIHIVPDTCVAPPNGRNPIPTDGRVISRVIRAERAAVLIRIVESLLLYAPGRGILLHPHSQGVFLAGMHQACYIETAAHQAAFDASELLAIEKDIRLPVNAAEVEP